MSGTSPKAFVFTPQHVAGACCVRPLVLSGLALTMVCRVRIAGVSGEDCRWYIYSPGAAQLYLNLAVSLQGPDAHVLIYEGAETQVYMHEDVLNAAVRHSCLARPTSWSRPFGLFPHDMQLSAAMPCGARVSCGQPVTRQSLDV